MNFQFQKSIKKFALFSATNETSLEIQTQQTETLQLTRQNLTVRHKEFIQRLFNCSERNYTIESDF